MARYAISDIHGCLDNFRQLLRKIDFQPTDTLFLLGDYIDRGPDSKGVIDYIWKLQADGYDIHCLRGNHEEMAIDNFRSGLYAYFDRPFLDSFGVKDYKEVPTIYYDWMEKLPHYFETEGYILVHAGLNLKKENPLADTESMLWIRNCEQDANFDWLDGRVIVHGHTPIAKIVMEYRLAYLDKLPVMDIDGGCVFTDHRPGLGYLCALNLDTRILTSVKRLSRNEY